jgi:hypothetical protein
MCNQLKWVNKFMLRDRVKANDEYNLGWDKLLF